MRFSKAAAICLILILANAAVSSATNWIYLGRHEGALYGSSTEYIDADSVFKTDDKITYWTILVLDEPRWKSNIKKMLWQKEAVLNAASQKNRLLASYYFDANNEEVTRYLEPSESFSDRTEEVARALGYAQTTEKANDSRPEHIVTPVPQWRGALAYDDCELYWDLHSLVAWPHDKPTTIDIRVKQIWTEEGIKKRKAFLATQKPYSQNKDNDVSSTVLACRFLLEQPAFRILEVTDYDSEGQGITVLDGTGWQRIEPGSMAEDIRNVVLNHLGISGN